MSPTGVSLILATPEALGIELAVFAVPFPLVIVSAVFIGYLVGRTRSALIERPGVLSFPSCASAARSRAEAQR